MICTRAFQGQAGSTFGLRVVGHQNLVSCTAEVMEGRNGKAREIARFSFGELEAGQATWPLQEDRTYVIVLRGQSKVPGKAVSIDTEIPLGSGSTSACSRMSSGVLGDWRVDVF